LICGYKQKEIEEALRKLTKISIEKVLEIRSAALFDAVKYFDESKYLSKIKSILS